MLSASSLRSCRRFLTAAALGTLLVTSAAGAARRPRAGSPDPLFGTAGVTRVSLHTYLTVSRIARQQDGGVVAACEVWQQIGNSNGPHFALVRFLADGALDTSFGTSGVLREDLGDLSNSELFAWASSVQVDGQGRLLATGGVAGGETSQFVLARYLSGGTPDPSFGVDGKVVGALGPNSDLFRTAVQPDGKIVAVGSSTLSGDRSVMLLRYRPNGTPDPDFGANGQVVTTLGNTSSATSLVLLPGGKLLVGGWVGDDACVLQYLPNGNLDTSFGIGGKVLVDIKQGSDFFTQIALQPNGRIVAAGGSYRGEGEEFVEHPVMVRLTSIGKIDRSFGKRGLVTGAGEGYVQDLVLQENGRLVTAGSAADRFVVSRFTPAGKPDRSFGKNGTAVVGTPSVGRSEALLLEPDGKIVAAGRAEVEGAFEAELLVTRLLAR